MAIRALDKTLHINLTDNQIKIKDVPLEMKEKFIGGKGYGLRYLWDATTPETKWNDPENEIIISEWTGLRYNPIFRNGKIPGCDYLSSNRFCYR